MTRTDLAPIAERTALRRIALPCALVLTLCGTAAYVQAQAFKCTNAQGHVSYQQTPCPQATAGDLFVDPLTRQRQENEAAHRTASAQQRAQYRLQQQQELQRLRQAVLQAGAARTGMPPPDDAATVLGLSENESIVPVDTAGAAKPQ
ncbi:hypothetical protein AAV94_13695 [Lampropedia cohaerens]|uniref:DUF4124 domain-containing protein n=1 Tax=Lampropedia cohaerens TaxID=1610491 RepID=A0A0U1PW87_9BURK|nr:DUF4124 domain-containing protein [Lampropedia cohaerens]KKW66802.1 hypothetical protein AAV94_13695 [Lampropedia cohaerens]